MEVGLLALRAVVGVIVAGHGAQKLFGWFSGVGAGLLGAVAAMGLGRAAAPAPSGPRTAGA